MDDRLTDEVLARLEQLSEAGDPPPWESWLDGRDHTSGYDFIQIGPEGALADDMYVTRGTRPAPAEDLELIAAARTYLPILIEEVKRLRGLAQPSN